MFILTERSIVDRDWTRSVEEKREKPPSLETGVRTAATAAGKRSSATLKKEQTT
jgi:hypothetical protein